MTGTAIKPKRGRHRIIANATDNPSRGRRYHKQTCVFAYLSPEIAAECRDHALKKQRSLSAEIRDLIEWGLAAREEAFNG